MWLVVASHMVASLCVDILRLMQVVLCACVSSSSGQVFKKLIDSIKDLVNEANFDCSSAGMSLQAMVRALVCVCVCVCLFV